MHTRDRGTRIERSWIPNRSVRYERHGGTKLVTSRTNPKSRQHYVPRFYLRHFAPTGSREQIFVLTTSDGRVFGPSPIKGIAQEKFFYDEPGDADQEIENWLQDLEGTASSLHAKLISAQSPSPLTRKERDEYSRFLAVQQRRTKRARHEIELILAKIVAPLAVDRPTRRQRIHIRSVAGPVIKHLRASQISDLRSSMETLARSKPAEAKLLLAEGLRIIKEEYAKYEKAVRAGTIPENMRDHFAQLGVNTAAIKSQHIRGLGELSSKIAQLIATMEWQVVINRTAVPFCTSDNPVAMVEASSLAEVVSASLNSQFELTGRLLGYTSWVTNGNVSPGLRILFPINPSLLLLLQPGQQESLDSISLTDSQTAVAFNAVQAIQGFERVFGGDGTSLAAVSSWARVAQQARRALHHFGTDEEV